MEPEASYGRAPSTQDDSLQNFCHALRLFRGKTFGLHRALWEQTEFLFAEIRRGRAKWLTVKDTVMPGREFCGICGTNNVTDEYLDIDGVEHRSTACQMCGHQHRLTRVSKEGQIVNVDVNDVPVIVGTMKAPNQSDGGS